MSLQQFSRLHSGIKAKIDPLELTAEIRYGSRSVNLRAGEKFLTTGAFYQSLNEAPVIRKGVFFLPDSVVEEIISELNLPVNYRIQEKKVEVKPDTAPSRSVSRFSFIVIDPGHGGKDPGALGVGGVREKTVVFTIARTLAGVLKKKFPHLKIYLTRSEPEFLELYERSRLANRLIQGSEWGIFISIHANASLSRKANGYEVYYLAQNPENESSRRVMLRENLLSGNKDVRMVESYLINARIQYESKMLARHMDKRLGVRLDGLVSSRGVKRADFAVLRGSLMPAVLIETGYLTNKNESEVLKTWKYRYRFSLAVAEGIENFIREQEKQ